MKLEYYHLASPNDRDLKQWWDEKYAKLAYEEYEKTARFPAELAPEYEPYWFWQKVYPIIWKIREKIRYSKIFYSMWDGYKLHEKDWIFAETPHGYRIKKQIPTRTPLWLQRTLKFVSKHIARWWGVVHFLEAVYIGDRWGWCCPHCGFESGALEDYFFSPWYKITESGSTFTGDYTQHWFEGFFDCPRCLRRWDYGDSD